jgi:hypothetical protein
VPIAVVLDAMADLAERFEICEVMRTVRPVVGAFRGGDVVDVEAA